jgi:hypothetical protein
MALLPSVPAGAQEIPPPPYLIATDEGVAIGIAYDAARIKKVAPAGVQIAPGATGIIVMYTAGELYGLPPYTSSWIGLDVEGFDAPGGGKARWMLTGLYGPEAVAAALAKHFNYPTRVGSTRVEREGRRVVVIGTVGGQELIRAELTLKGEACQRGPAMTHEVTRKPETDSIQLIKIPHVGNWCAAESTKVEISAPASDPLGQIGPVKVLWGGYFRGGFGWSAPVIARWNSLTGRPAKAGGPTSDSTRTPNSDRSALLFLSLSIAALDVSPMAGNSR